MRKMMAVMLMGLALTALELGADAQSRGKSERKPAATANNRKPSPAAKPSTRPMRPDVKPGGTGNKPSGPAAKPNGPSTKPSGPAAKPGGPSTKPSGPAAKPGGPAAKPGGSSTKPGGPGMKPAPKPAPKPGYRPAPKPGHGPGYRPGYRPAPRPKPVIVVRPSYGSIIAANIASGLILSAVRAASTPVYVNVSPGLNLTHSYVAAGTEYYYQDGVFYIVDARGQYVTIMPPTGALVEYLPEDYTTFRYDGSMYYRVDDTVYALTLSEGTPYFEVLGQIR